VSAAIVHTLSRALVLGLVRVGLASQPMLAGELRTDPSRPLVPLDEIVSGGPPPAEYRLRQAQEGLR
jgi:hypothetical protein